MLSLGQMCYSVHLCIRLIVLGKIAKKSYQPIIDALQPERKNQLLSINRQCPSI